MPSEGLGRGLPPDGRPAAGTALISLAELGDPGARGFTFRHERRLFEIFLVRKADVLRAYVNACPHRGTPLDWVPHKFLDAEGEHIVCATHGARFDLLSGACVSGPCPGTRLREVPVEIVNGTVLLA